MTTKEIEELKSKIAIVAVIAETRKAMNIYLRRIKIKYEVYVQYTHVNTEDQLHGKHFHDVVLVPNESDEMKKLYDLACLRISREIDVFEEIPQNEEIKQALEHMGFRKDGTKYTKGDYVIHIVENTTILNAFEQLVKYGVRFGQRTKAQEIRNVLEI